MEFLVKEERVNVRRCERGHVFVLEGDAMCWRTPSKHENVNCES